jgi:tRNA1Val (adenine37-N6)-methyltransferase
LTEKTPEEEETLDDLRFAGLKILQPRVGYRFSLDPVLLCAFAVLDGSERLADLGTGSGVMPLILAGRGHEGPIVGVELQPQLADRARRSVELNGLEEKIAIIEGDLRALPASLAPGTFDGVLSNPPYRKPGTGKVAAGSERGAARHELSGGIGDFVRAAALLLKPGGRFFVIFLAERLNELLAVMSREALEPKRLRSVHSRPGEGAKMVLVEGRKGGRAGLSLEAPLFVYDGDRYSEEVLRIYGEG